MKRHHTSGRQEGNNNLPIGQDQRKQGAKERSAIKIPWYSGSVGKKLACWSTELPLACT